LPVCLPSPDILDGINGDHVLLAPPYAATEEELEEILDRLVISIDQVMDAVAAS
jgi:adenosylmethionine-8-amino-7-oxononanoate aminotransferase